MFLVVSDSVGSRFLSGFGGQVDFIRGAAIGDDGKGKPIIALPSVTKKGVSKIVPYINEVLFFLLLQASVYGLVVLSLNCGCFVGRRSCDISCPCTLCSH